MPSFPPPPHSQTLIVSGMSCSHCKRAVESAIRGAMPLAVISVDLEKGTATIASHTPFDSHAIIDAIDDLGYSAQKSHND